jgi:hypothetical protein
MMRVLILMAKKSFHTQVPPPCVTFIYLGPSTVGGPDA